MNVDSVFGVLLLHITSRRIGETEKIRGPIFLILDRVVQLTDVRGEYKTRLHPLAIIRNPRRPGEFFGSLVRPSPLARGIIKIQIETRAIARENPARSHETKPSGPSVC